MDIMMSEFQKRVARHARRDRTPLSCLFEITPTCNLRCHFCYVALDPYRGPYLSTEQVCRVLDIVRDAGVLWLTLTGGEILSRRDFPEIYRHARANGFLVTLFTNATMVNDRIADLLRESPPFSVEVSIYGPTAEVYEATTQIPGSYARFVRGVDLLRSVGIRPLMKTPLSRFTEDLVPDLIAWCRERDLPLKLDPQIDYQHDGGGNPGLYRIEPRRRVALHRTIIEAQGYEPDLEGASRVGPLPECSDTGGEPASEELYTCSAGRTAFFIDGLGTVSHCVIDRSPTFPILSTPWEEIWSRIGEWVTQPLPSDAPCSGCGLRTKCSNCPARARLATGSPYLKDPYLCDVSHAAAGLEPLAHPDYRAMSRPAGACVTNRASNSPSPMERVAHVS